MNDTDNLTDEQRGLKKSKGGRQPIPESERKRSFTFRATPGNLQYLNAIPAGTRSEFLNLLLNERRNAKKNVQKH